MEDLKDLGGRYLSVLNLVILDSEGRQAGFSNVEGRSYTYITAEMDEPEETPRTVVATRMKGG